MMTGGFILSQERMFSIQFQSAQDRYSQLLSRHPDIIQRGTIIPYCLLSGYYPGNAQPHPRKEITVFDIYQFGMIAV
jgi:hypothetical protein